MNKIQKLLHRHKWQFVESYESVIMDYTIGGHYVDCQETKFICFCGEVKRVVEIDDGRDNTKSKTTNSA